MDWTVSGASVGTDEFRDIEPNEVLYDFDGPRIFTASTPLGELLFYLADEQDGICRHVAAPTNPRILGKLKSGVLSVRQALDQPWVWVVDAGYDGVPVAAWKGTLADIPGDALPQPGVMLWPELEPVFALRAIGDDLAEGQVPASVIRQVVDGAMTALKKISSQIFDTARAQGRKANIYRQFYDLPAQGFAYNSFEVAFRLPVQKQRDISEEAEADDWDKGFEEIGSSLEHALEWATAPDAEDKPHGLGIAFLEALEKLVPPQRGVVKAVELRGRIFRGGRRHYRLTREASKKVRGALSQARITRERLCQVSGLVREFDKDNFSFTLRETDDGKEHFCTFLPELYDEVNEVFGGDLRIAVMGRENLENGEIEVALISRDAPEKNSAPTTE